MDLTILYYTANLIPEPFSSNVRNHLLESAKGIPIISISHKPINFGDNLTVYGLEPCIYNVYLQILMGARQVKTKYVACCEDDALYVPDHFAFIPLDDTFFYNTNKWNAYRGGYSFKTRRNMSMCIASTQLMIDTLEKRFAKYPVKGSQVGWGEPGRHEGRLGLPLVKIDSFKTTIPTLTFSHRGSLGGSRRIMPNDIIEKELPHWGKASDLWEKMWNG